MTTTLMSGLGLNVLLDSEVTFDIATYYSNLRFSDVGPFDITTPPARSNPTAERGTPQGHDTRMTTLHLVGCRCGMTAHRRSGAQASSPATNRPFTVKAAGSRPGRRPGMKPALPTRGGPPSKGDRLACGTHWPPSRCSGRAEPGVRTRPCCSDPTLRQTWPRQAPVSVPRDSMNVLNRLRSSLAFCRTNPILSATASARPFGSCSICSITLVRES
jgi:hypothetical protein